MNTDAYPTLDALEVFTKRLKKLDVDPLWINVLVTYNEEYRIYATGKCYTEMSAANFQDSTIESCIKEIDRACDILEDYCVEYITKNPELIHTNSMRMVEFDESGNLPTKLISIVFMAYAKCSNLWLLEGFFAKMA